MSGNTGNGIQRYYNDADESSRLRTGWFRLEHARTQELILRHIQPAPATVLDVGGGTGVYALWLASRGYRVHLIDPIRRHIEQARETSAKSKTPLASTAVGDARKLEAVDATADSLLLLGPLYHLTERADRLTALREAHRVLRSGGLLWAAGISRFASLLDSLSGGFFEQADFAPILERDLENGQHRNPTGNLDYFTDAFFHLPEELTSEVKEAGFQVLELVTVEGPGWLARDFDRLWNQPQQRERLLAHVRKVEHEPSLIGASSHLMVIAQKP